LVRIWLGTTVTDTTQSFSYTLMLRQYLDRLERAGLPD